MLIYFALGLVGLILLVLSFVLGEVDDLLSFDLFPDHDGLGPFNAKVLSAVLTGFGATGMLTTYYGWGPLPSALTSGAVGLGVGAAGWWLLNLVYGQESSTDFVMSSLRGQLCEVTTTIPEGGVGQVLCSGPSGSRQLLARTHDGGSIPFSQTVRIVDTIGSTLIVEAVHSVPGAQQPTREPLPESTS